VLALAFRPQPAAQIRHRSSYEAGRHGLPEEPFDYAGLRPYRREAVEAIEARSEKADARCSSRWRPALATLRIHLLQDFTAPAVIAIENARLFT